MKPIVDRDVPHRSWKYQHLYCELSFADLQPFDLIYNSEVNNNKSEEIKELQDELFKRVIEIAEINLNERQYKVLIMRFIQEMDQIDIGKEIGGLQSDIQKCLNGVDKKSKDGTINRVGGLVKKLKIAVENDQTIKDILEKIQKIST